MKKALFILPLLVFLTTACTSGPKNLSVNEKTAPENMENSNQKDVLERINQINNGATPKVKPTGEADDEKTPPPLSKPTTQTSSNKTINESVNNMNTAVIKTNKGIIKVRLNPEKAPVTVENFKQYATSGYYGGTIFHRVIPGFMIQGGGFIADATQKDTREPIIIESDNGLENKRGTIAMARTMVPNSATSQFFINLVDNDMLDYRSPDQQGYGYAVFGEVIEGMEVVDEIAMVQTGANGPHQDWPKDDIMIEGVVLE